VAWSILVVQSSSGESLRTKVSQRNKEHMLDISVCFSMVRGGRSGGLCQRLAFGAPVLFRRLRLRNEELNTGMNSPLNLE
jgi:hypothetical protein